MMSYARRLILSRQVVSAYCLACHRLFGKTISVMAGEAGEARRWYGRASVAFIDWLLDEPHHCATQLVYYRRLERR
jgi:hypothetical protein